MVDNMAAYSLGHMMALPALLLLVWRWCARWMDETRALIGVGLVCAYLPLMFQATYGIALYTIVEAVIVAAWLLLIFPPNPLTEFSEGEKRIALLIGLVVVGTLNRETAVMLPLLYAAVYPRRWRVWGTLLAVWLATFAGVRAAVGGGESFASIAQLWAWNTGAFAGLSVLHVGLTVPLWAAAAAGARGADARLQRVLGVALVYGGLYAVFGLWNEVRLLLPVLVMCLPVIVRWVVKPCPPV